MSHKTVITLRENFLTFGAPDIQEPEIAEVVASLRSGWIGTGPKVERFQKEFAKYIGTQYATALNSCTGALHLAMLASGVKPGDEVITTPMTFCATVNAILHVGARPVFADIDRSTMNIDPAQIEKAITDRTKAIIPVHFTGRPCDMDPIMQIAKKYQLRVIEDAAHCIEGRYHNQKIGAIGDLACFSFYVTKNLTTAEGGMVTTNNPEWADKVKVFGLHGMSRDAWLRYSDEGFKHYEVQFAGFKYNMTDIQAALGIHQLERIEANLKRREQIWEFYNEQFSKLPLTLPLESQRETRHARHLYTVLVDCIKDDRTRDKFQHDLHQWNIGSGVHYIALHMHKYYQELLGCRPGDFPEAEFVSQRILSLPLSSALSDDDVQYVANVVKEILK